MLHKLSGKKEVKTERKSATRTDCSRQLGAKNFVADSAETLFKGLVTSNVAGKSEKRSEFVRAGAGFFQKFLQERTPGVVLADAFFKDVEQFRANEEAKLAARAVDLLGNIRAFGSERVGIVVGNWHQSR